MCKLVAIVLHYAYLVHFMALMMEALHNYVLYTMVLTSEFDKVIISTCFSCLFNFACRHQYSQEVSTFDRRNGDSVDTSIIHSNSSPRRLHERDDVLAGFQHWQRRHRTCTSLCYGCVDCYCIRGDQYEEIQLESNSQPSPSCLVNYKLTLYTSAGSIEPVRMALGCWPSTILRSSSTSWQQSST